MSKIMIFPTDTVYGIGCNIFDLESQKQIFAIKHRPFNKPLPVLCANLAQIEEVVVVTSLARKLIDAFLPGPLTIILNTTEEVFNKTGFKTLGVRIPNSKIAIDILLENGPMATTSVNESGQPPLNSYDEIKAIYGEYDTTIIPNDKISFSSNVASTVVNCTHNMLEVLRVGEISLPELIQKV